MKPKNKNEFDVVEFMRQTRDKSRREIEDVILNKLKSIS